MMKCLGAVVVLVLLALAGGAGLAQAPDGTGPAVETGAKLDPSKLLVRPRTGASVPDPWSDPLGWIALQQRKFAQSLQSTMHAIRADSSWRAAFALIGLSFAYGIFHAAGPGHGKAVVSAWLLANEHQVRRGVMIAFMAALIQAASAIVMVSAVLGAVSAAGTLARQMTFWLEAASYGLIALLGVYMLWHTLRPIMAPAGHGHCGHSHMPGAGDIGTEGSWTKAWPIAFAVGIRPCSGAILALLASSAIGIYWVGVAATLVMALGTAITVSAIAVLAVTSRSAALAFAGGNAVRLERIALWLKLAGAVAITFFGATLLWAAFSAPPGFVQGS